MQVFGDKDADGFYYGECNGRRGLVPSNIVAVVEVDDAEAAMQLLDENCQSVAPDSSVTSSRASSETSSSYLTHQQGILTRAICIVNCSQLCFELVFRLHMVIL